MAAPENVVDLASKYREVAGLWSPHIVAEFNGFHVKLARVHGEFVWHTHTSTDEMFIVHSGSLEIQMRDRPTVRLAAGALFVVPAGVEHRPVAEDECELLLVEPANTPNRGDAATATAEPWI